MKIEKIFYQKLFPTGAYSNEKIGIEAIVEPGETAEQCLSAAKAKIDEWHKRNNPQDYMADATVAPTIEVEKDASPVETRVAALIRDINSCKEVKVLETYRFMVKQDPRLQEAYDKKHKDLSK